MQKKPVTAKLMNTFHNIKAVYCRHFFCLRKRVDSVANDYIKQFFILATVYHMSKEVVSASELAAEKT